MKKIKRALAILLVVVCLGAMFVPSCLAAETTFSRHVDINSSSIDDDRFAYEWEHTRYFLVDGKVKAKLVYGFNTFLVHEDYAWTMGEEYETKGGIKRADDGSGKAYDTSITWSDYKNKNVYSKREMRHTRNNVYYYCKINFDYSGKGKYTYSTTLNTNVK